MPFGVRHSGSGVQITMPRAPATSFQMLFLEADSHWKAILNSHQRSSFQQGLRTRHTLEPLAWHWSHLPGISVNRGGWLLELCPSGQQPPWFSAAERGGNSLLVRIHFIIENFRWTGLAPWEFEFPLPGSLVFEDLRAENGSR
jgi:hypothetical protein